MLKDTKLLNSDIFSENNLLENMSSLGMHIVHITFPIHFSTTCHFALDVFFVSDNPKCFLYLLKMIKTLSRLLIGTTRLFAAKIW